MATIEKRTSPKGVTYRVRIRMQGQPERTATFAKKTDAQAWAEQVGGDLKRGRYVPTNEALRRTVAMMIDRYIADVLPFKNRNADQQCAKQRLTWWRAQIGDYWLAQVTPAVIADCKLKLAREKVRHTGRVRSPSTVNHYLTDLSACFKAAMREWHWVEHSPMTGVSKFKEPQGRVRFLSDAERERLLKACSEVDRDLHDLVTLALVTGARRGELEGLRWPDVNLKRATATLHDTKNGHRRALTLAGPALDVMRERSKVRAIDDDRVFPNRLVKGAPINIRRSWPAALARAGIENFRFHDLRHTCASYLAMNGASVAELAGVLGHRTLAMVQRYAHLSEGHVAGVVTRMVAKVFGDGTA